MVLDCGAGHVAAGLFTRGNGRLRLEQFAWEPFSIPAGRDDLWPEALRAALCAVAARLKHHGSAIVVLPGHLVLTKFIKAPRVEPAKRERVIRFEAQQNIPYALSDVAWGHVVVGESDLDLDVMLCAAKLDAVEGVCAAVEAARLTPRALVPGVLALHSACRAGPDRTPVLFADIGVRSTTLLLEQGVRLHARTLALGGLSVPQQSVPTRECSPAEGERQKNSADDEVQRAPALESFAVRLSQEITRTALHFKRQAGAASPERLLLTGGGAQCPGLAEALASRLHVPVAHWDPLASIELAPSAVEARGQAASLGALVGAAMALEGPGAPWLSLLPPRLLTQEDRRRRQPWLAVAALLSVAALMPPWMHFRAREAALRHRLAALDAEIAPLRQREALHRANLEKLTALHGQIAVLHDIASRRARWLQLLADLQARFVKVEDVWLERLQLVAPTGDEAAPLRIAVSGRMLDRTNPLARVSQDASRRVAALLAGVVDSPYVSAVEGERFDDRQPGILRFDFVLVAEPAKPL